MEFYVTLFSTKDLSKIFSIRLNRPLYFPSDENWKVAFSEISLTSLIHNVKKDSIRIEKRKKRSFTIDLPNGSYSNHQDLYNTIQDASRPKILKHFTPTNIALKPGHNIHFTENLSKTFDLPKSVNNFDSKNLILTPKFQKLTKCICVLGNFVEERILDEQMEPLLTSFIPKCLEGETSMTIEPYPLEYLKVKPGFYEEFQFQLKTIDGENINFRDNFFLINLKFVRQ